MTTYYKAVRPDGMDFFSGTVRWLPEDGIIPPGGWLVEHPAVTPVGRDADMSVFTDTTDCRGMMWPCRLLVVEAVGEVVTPEPGRLPSKRGVVAGLVLAELPAHEALGPQGAEVAAIIDHTERLTDDQALRLDAAQDAAQDDTRDAARDASWSAALSAGRYAAWYAARHASRDAAWDAARDPSWDAAHATLVRDLITSEQYDLLIGPWRSVIGDPVEVRTGR